MSSGTHNSTRHRRPIPIRFWVAATATLFVVGGALSWSHVEGLVGERATTVVMWTLLGLWLVSFFWVILSLDRATAPAAVDDHSMIPIGVRPDGETVYSSMRQSAGLGVPEPRQQASATAESSTRSDRGDLQLRARHHAARCVAAAWAGCEVMSADLWSSNPSAVAVSTSGWASSDAAFAKMVSLVAGHVTAGEGGGDEDSAKAEIREVLEHAAGIIASGQAPSEYHGALVTDALVATARGTARHALRYFSDVVETIADSLVEAGWLGGDQLQLLLWPVAEARPDAVGRVWTDA